MAERRRRPAPSRCPKHRAGWERRVRDALNAADWLSVWCAGPADDFDWHGTASTARLVLVDPSSRLLRSLRALGRVRETSCGTMLLGAWPMVGGADMLAQATIAVVRLLTSEIGSDAGFVAIIEPAAF